MTFASSVTSKSGSTTGFTVSPSSVVIQAGGTSADFTITVSSGLADGEFLVSWSLSSESSDYVAPINTMYIVDSTITYPLLMDTVPTLIKGKESLPIYIYLPVATAETAVGLKVTSLTEGVTASSVCSSPGSDTASFTITTDNEVDSLLSGSIQVELDCKDASSFMLQGPSVHTFAITNFDTENPGLASFVINSPKSRMGADMTM